MIKLELIDPHWINGHKDDPEDQCSHGNIRFVIDDLVIVEPKGEWTVSAAALFLLRTVTRDHSAGKSVSPQN